MALLLTYNIWFGPSRDAMFRERVHGEVVQKPEWRLEGYYTELDLPAAITEIKRYEEAYRVRYAAVTAVNYRLITVATIDSLTPEARDTAGLFTIERMVAAFAENG